MRKILLTAVILAFTAGLASAQFVAGTKTLGGGLNYHKDMTDYGDVDLGATTITVSPSMGYFVIDDLMLYAGIAYQKVSFSDEYLDLMMMEDNPDATTAFIVGGRYFINYLYVGAGYRFQSAVGDGDAVTGLVFEGGYLYPITDYLFVDFGLDYYFGMSDDEMKYLDVGIGFATFF